VRRTGVFVLAGRIDTATARASRGCWSVSVSGARP